MNTDDFLRELTRSPSHAALRGSDLQDLAKRASDMFLHQDTPLRDAVVKVASEYPGISQEQVKRVVEMANSTSYQRLFEKNASKNIHFDIADPSEVLRQLNSGASAPVLKVASADYAAAPPTSGFRDLEADLALAQVFGVALEPTSTMQKVGMVQGEGGESAPDRHTRVKTAGDIFDDLTLDPEKLASARAFEETLELVTPPEVPETVKEAVAFVKSMRPGAELVSSDLQKFASLESVKTAARKNDLMYPEENPYGDLMRTRQQLEKMAEDLQEAIDTTEHHHKLAMAELGHYVVQHVLSGNNLGEVVHVMAGLGTPEQVKEAMEQIMPALERRVPMKLASLQADIISYEMEKGASARVVNPEHPIAKAFAGMLKAAADLEHLVGTRAVIRPLHKQAHELVQQVAAKAG